MVGAASAETAEQLVELYPSALPQVFGFLASRCSSAAVAEDLTAETFMAAVSAITTGTVDTITVGWLIVVARRRLVDYWRQQEREQRHLRLIDQPIDETSDPWDDEYDVAATRAALERLGPHHQAVLTLRYLDGLPVREVAKYLARGVPATEALLHRARLALRRAYIEGGIDGD